MPPQPPQASDPSQRSRQTLAEYEGRLTRRRAAAADARRIENLLSIARLVVFLTTAAAGVTVLFQPLFDPWWLLPPTVLFVALVLVHDRRLRRRRRAERGAAFYERGIACVRFEAPLEPDAPDAENEHLYASDLDVLGPGSLFERLRTARTDAGKSCLRDWLLEPAVPSTIRGRQQAVIELAEKLDLREDLAAIGAEIGRRVDSRLLTQWASKPSRLAGRWQPWVAAGLGLATLTSVTLWLAGIWSAVPFLAAGWIAGGFALVYHRRVEELLAEVHGPEHDLRLLADLLLRLEAEEFSAPYLRRLREAIASGDRPASLRIRRLQFWVAVADLRQNKIVAPFAAMLFFGTQVAFALERWKAESGTQVEAWVQATAELEALASLGAFYAEHPQATMPTIVDEGPAKVAGANLVHPLLPSCVPNDLDLGERRRLLLVSGSNMSGKSTWLRTIGTNVALAQAGGPVCAESMTLTPVTVGAAMRIADSLQRGMSHFYAEISRLRQIVDATAAERPVLFLLDEILHGTNSHDRRIGAQGVIRGLLDAGAIGLVTTHDLALAAIADELGAQAENVHFEDHLEHGEMRFDFKVRPGVVQKSNALELMRSVGLKV